MCAPRPTYRLGLVLVLILGAMTIMARAASISVSLVNPGSGTVTTGTPVGLEVRATFDTRLSAVAFQLDATGPAEASITDRSLNPTGSNGLTYVSLSSQMPFASGLPHDIKASPILEVAYDNDFGAAPGSALDGLAPGAGVLVEQITIVPTGLGTVDVTLSNLSAAHTTAAPDGSLFEVADVAIPTVQLTVTSLGDADMDGDVDLIDFAMFPACMTGPDNGPVSIGCEVFDFNADDDVDHDDFAGFQLAFTG